MSLSTQIAKFIMNPEPFTENAVYLAKRSIIDTMGAMIAGAGTDAVKMSVKMVEHDGPCSIIGSDISTSSRDAAFVNGISGHELELDDTSSSNLGHPTVAVLPSLLALAEERGCTGKRLIESFLIATEVECKIGRICAKKLHERGWHCSSITGVIGAACGCAYLIRLSETKICNAIGIAASMAAGIRENFGTLTKSIHIGKTAEDGMRAALLAEEGFTSSLYALEGNEGYIFEYTGLRDDKGSFDKIIDSMGKDWDICSPGFTIKQHPSCSSTHRPLDAFLDIMNENSFTAGEIDKIDIWLGKSALRELVTPYPKDGEEAKFSVGFQIALYLSGMENAPYNYTESVIKKPEIQDIINKTFMHEEDKYNNLPSDMGVGPATVVVQLKNGHSLSETRNFPVGHLTDPISDDDLKKKYMGCTAEHLGYEKAVRLYDMLFSLETISDIKEITDLTH